MPYPRHFVVNPGSTPEIPAHIIAEVVALDPGTPLEVNWNPATTYSLEQIMAMPKGEGRRMLAEWNSRDDSAWAQELYRQEEEFLHDVREDARFAAGSPQEQEEILLERLMRRGRTREQAVEALARFDQRLKASTSG